MDKELFEQAIAPYTIKQVDKSNPVIVSYELKRAFRTESLEKSATGFSLRFSRRPVNKVYVTPLGEFSNSEEAAKAHNISVANLYNRLTKSKKLNNKEYYVYEKEQTDQPQVSVLGTGLQDG